MNAKTEFISIYLYSGMKSIEHALIEEIKNNSVIVPRGDSLVKVTRMLVVSLRGVNCKF